MSSRRNFLKGAAAVGLARLCLPAASLVATGLPTFVHAQETDYLPNPQRIGSRLDELARFINPELDLFNPHTDERIQVRFFTPLGYDMNAVNQINHIFRDWRQNVAPQIDPRLFWAIAATRTSAMKDGHDGAVTLLSGYRTLATTRLLRSQGVGAALGSQHMKAAAGDLRLEGIPAKTISGYMEWLQVGGVGYYPNSNFTHADTGNVRQWQG